MTRAKYVEVEFRKLFGKTIKNISINNSNNLDIIFTDNSEFQIDIFHDGSDHEFSFYEKIKINPRGIYDGKMMELAKEVKEGKFSTMELQEILFSNPWITPALIEEMRQEEQQQQREELQRTNDGKMLASQLAGVPEND